MGVNSKIITALAVTGCPVVPESYSGTATTYITFNYEDDRAGAFADDTPQADVAFMQIHLFTTADYMTLKATIRKALFDAGFTYPTVTTLYEEETKYHHIVFRCSIEGTPEI